MSQKQLNRYTVLSKLIEGQVTTKEAAERLGLSERQVKRLRKGVREEGPAFLIHKNTGCKPVHAIPDALVKRIIELRKSENYQNANFLHFQELLKEHESIEISYKALYGILTRAGFKSPKKRRKGKAHHRRKRRAQEGLLIQMDATPFAWFGTDQNYTLHGAIDDATGKILGLYLARKECLQGYFEVVRRILGNHGIPASIYSDRHSIFHSPKTARIPLKEQLAGKEAPRTQFGRAMNELGITLIPARSPQAKGRIERLWDTLQGRLPVELKIAGIADLRKANQFFMYYIPAFNARFAVSSAVSETAFTSLKEGLVIDHILCCKQTRTVDNSGVFSFKGQHFQVTSQGGVVSIPPKSRVEGLVSPAFGIRVQYQNAIYEAIPCIQAKRRKTSISCKEKRTYHPPEDHCYKYGRKLWPKLSFAESDAEILQMLEEIFLKNYA
jgi:transposase